MYLVFVNVAFQYFNLASEVSSLLQVLPELLRETEH